MPRLRLSSFVIEVDIEGMEHCFMNYVKYLGAIFDIIVTGLAYIQERSKRRPSEPLLQSIAHSRASN
jgi:hypothetical protein